MMTLNRTLTACFALALSAAAVPAMAVPTIVDGSFEQFTAPAANNATVNNTDLVGWQTTSGYTFDLTASQATGGFVGPEGSLSLYGPSSASPDGGRFLATDGPYHPGYTYQTVTGLTTGQQYTISFYQAATQQVGYGGNTSDYWTVGFGSTYASSSFLNSPTLYDASNSTTPWQYVSLTFTATGTSDVLSFMAQGAPSSSQPPFALLDGVTIAVSVPEPTSVTLMGLGLLVLVGARAWYGRRERSASAL